MLFHQQHNALPLFSDYLSSFIRNRYIGGSRG